MLVPTVVLFVGVALPLSAIEGGPTQHWPLETDRRPVSVPPSGPVVAPSGAATPGGTPARRAPASVETEEGPSRGPASTAGLDKKPSVTSGDEEISIQDEESDTPVSHDQIAGDEKLVAARPWRAPDYSNQEDAVGWSETAFEVPKGLEVNVAFWKDIYTKYTTDQGVIHDSEYIDLIYEVIDFSPIVTRTDLTGRQKERLKTKAVKEAKKRVKTMLQKFEKLDSPGDLTEEEKRIWDYFATKINEKKKFKRAQQKSRLRFQLGQKDRIIQGIFFSGRYLEEFEKIFREAGLPIELTRLVFVESSFNVLARSKVGASGLWQIMAKTARPYRMINRSIDKRNHPMEATKVAARLLRINFDMLGAWPLAVTGYNHGPSGVLRLTKIHRSRDLADLSPRNAKKRLGFASRNFYPSFLAVLEVEKNAPKYLGNVTWSQPLANVDLKTPFEIRYSDILRWFDGDDHRAQIFNPHITYRARSGKISIPKGSIVSVPASKEQIVRAELNDPKRFKKIGLNK